MAYEVTATRRRPKNFDELAGQEFTAATLKNSLETGHIAHAYLFSGPRGCGKTSAARILAKALRCEKGLAANPCGVCTQCLEIARGASIDVIEIDGASNTSVNDVRQIKEEVLFPPSSGKYKVYIIDEVHMLSNSAFNALLKTIEEPPPNVVFIFATTELQKVPATIKSRCQQFNFRLIPVETIKELLAKACGETGIEAEDEALFWIAREATGSIRDAYTLFDQVVSFSEGRIRSEVIREKLGLVGLDKLNEFAESCISGDFAGALAQADALISGGVAVEQFVNDLAGYYHSLLLIKAGVSRESILGYPPERFSAKTLQKLDSVRLAQAGELLFNLHRDIRYSVSPRFELENVTSKLCWLEQWISPLEMASAVKQAEAVLKGGTRPLAVRAPEGPDKNRENSAWENPAPGAPKDPDDGIKPGQEGFLNEGFKRYRAAKESGGADPEPAREPPAAEALPQTEDENESGVKTVLRLFNGTIVKTGMET
jgi:DNA polymerase-3 subunit gamma/tau